MSEGEASSTGPSQQPVSPWLHERREMVFLVLAGLFLGTLAMLNILGISRFIVLGSLGEAGWQWGKPAAYTFAVAVGVLPYPITFLCTDFISEFYGRKRASAVVCVGLLLNVWVMFILWLGGVLPGFETLEWDAAKGNYVQVQSGEVPLFYQVRKLAFGAVLASMVAYLVAQFVDVYVFHFWKRLTKGRLLWVRNNGSTMVSQIVDTVAVILITYWVGGFDTMIDEDTHVPGFLALLVATGYVFKFAVAALDTIPFYLGSAWLKRYLQIDPTREHDADREEAGMVGFDALREPR